MKSNWVTNEAIDLLTGMCCFLLNGLMTLQLSVMGILVKCTPAAPCFLGLEMSSLWTEARDEKFETQICFWRRIRHGNEFLRKTHFWNSHEHSSNRPRKESLMHLKPPRPSRSSSVMPLHLSEMNTSITGVAS